MREGRALAAVLVPSREGGSWQRRLRRKWLRGDGVLRGGGGGGSEVERRYEVLLRGGGGGRGASREHLHGEHFPLSLRLQTELLCEYASLQINKTIKQTIVVAILSYNFASLCFETQPCLLLLGLGSFDELCMLQRLDRLLFTAALLMHMTQI